MIIFALLVLAAVLVYVSYRIGYEKALREVLGELTKIEQRHP